MPKENGGTKAERRDKKKRKRMPVSGKEVFKLQTIISKPSKKRSQGSKKKKK